MPRALIVDDAPFQRAIMRDLLTGLGVEICGEAENGQEGVEQYEKLKPDLVTMDVVMPFKSGLEATKEILGKHPHARIIAVTSLTDPELRAELIGVGAKAVFGKPFDSDAFSLEVKKVLELAVDPALQQKVEERRQAVERAAAAKKTWRITISGSVDVEDEHEQAPSAEVLSTLHGRVSGGSVDAIFDPGAWYALAGVSGGKVTLRVLDKRVVSEIVFTAIRAPSEAELNDLLADTRAFIAHETFEHDTLTITLHDTGLRAVVSAI